MAAVTSSDEVKLESGKSFIPCGRCPGEKRDADIHTEGKHVTTRAETGLTPLQARKRRHCQQHRKPRERQGTPPPSQPLRAQPCCRPELGPPAPQQWQGVSLCDFAWARSGAFGYGSPRKLIHLPSPRRTKHGGWDKHTQDEGNKATRRPEAPPTPPGRPGPGTRLCRMASPVTQLRRKSKAGGSPRWLT